MIPLCWYGDYKLQGINWFVFQIKVTGRQAHVDFYFSLYFKYCLLYYELFV